MNPKVDLYIEEGCGRCELGGTPDCKVHLWTDLIVCLREIVQDCGLTEELKWGVPCYTFQGKNILMVSAFKNFTSLSFFKGSLLKDPHKILHAPGEHSQASRQFKFLTLDEINDQEKIIKEYIFEAIEVEKAGLQVKFKKTTEDDRPEELVSILEKRPDVKEAFESLTPGRQRGYNLYFAAAKQSATRVSRIEKYIPKILSRKGFHDR